MEVEVVTPSRLRYNYLPQKLTPTWIRRPEEASFLM